MSNWSGGYRDGYWAAATKLLKTPEELNEFMARINKCKDGSPSNYAVANSCCGGIDAHAVGCRG